MGARLLFFFCAVEMTPCIKEVQMSLVKEQNLKYGIFYIVSTSTMFPVHASIVYEGIFIVILPVFYHFPVKLNSSIQLIQSTVELRNIV